MKTKRTVLVRESRLDQNKIKSAKGLSKEELDSIAFNCEFKLKKRKHYRQEFSEWV